MPAIAATIWVRGPPPWPCPPPSGGTILLAMSATTRGSHPHYCSISGPRSLQNQYRACPPTLGVGQSNSLLTSSFQLFIRWSAAYNCLLAALQLCLIYLEGSAFSAETLPSAHPIHFFLTLAFHLSPLYHSLSTFSLLLLFLSHCPYLHILFLCYSFLSYYSYSLSISIYFSLSYSIAL